MDLSDSSDDDRPPASHPSPSAKCFPHMILTFFANERGELESFHSQLVDALNLGIIKATSPALEDAKPTCPMVVPVLNTAKPSHPGHLGGCAQSFLDNHRSEETAEAYHCRNEEHARSGIRRALRTPSAADLDNIAATQPDATAQPSVSPDVVSAKDSSIMSKSINENFHLLSIFPEIPEELKPRVPIEFLLMNQLVELNVQLRKKVAQETLDFLILALMRNPLDAIRAFAGLSRKTLTSLLKKVQNAESHARHESSPSQGKDYYDEALAKQAQTELNVDRERKEGQPPHVTTAAVDALTKVIYDSLIHAASEGDFVGAVSQATWTQSLHLLAAVAAAFYGRTRNGYVEDVISSVEQHLAGLLDPGDEENADSVRLIVDRAQRAIRAQRAAMRNFRTNSKSRFRRFCNRFEKECGLSKYTPVPIITEWYTKLSQGQVVNAHEASQQLARKIVENICEQMKADFKLAARRRTNTAGQQSSFTKAFKKFIQCVKDEIKEFKLFANTPLEKSTDTQKRAEVVSDSIFNQAFTKACAINNDLRRMCVHEMDFSFFFVFFFLSRSSALRRFFCPWQGFG
jgi:hypothetical protein